MKRIITISFIALLAISFTGFAQQNMLSEYGSAEVSGTSTYEPSMAPVVFLDQAPNQLNGIFSDCLCVACASGAQVLADNFVVTAASPTFGITEIVMWGGYYPENIPNTTDDFTITIFEDAAGAPGTVFYTASGLVPTTRATTGIILFGVDEYICTFDYSASPIMIPTNGTYHIQISNNSVESGSFFWEVGDLDAVNGIIGQSWAPECFPVTWNYDSATDMAIQINGDDDIGGGLSCDLLTDTFDADIAQWTEIGPMGIGNWTWSNSNNAAGSAAGELEFSWTPSFTGDSYIISPVLPSAGFINTTISFEHFLDWYGGPFTIGCATTTDGGTSWTTVWSVVDPPGNVGPENVTVPYTGDANLQIGFFYSGDSFNINFWYIDDVCVDGIVPVELTSFTAAVNERNVTLNWTTATETNNQGFEIERNSGNGFAKIGYVAGFGTSSETHNYSFVDQSLNEGTYSYRLKQVDYDGTFEYSDVVEVDVTAPKVFALEQNYPNPFNPGTKINFNLAADSKVNLTVFDVLGQEVANLISGNLAAGSHEINFNASNINSGVYFYRIDATGVDGTNFTSVKKMILTK